MCYYRYFTNNIIKSIQIIMIIDKYCVYTVCDFAVINEVALSRWEKNGNTVQLTQLH